MKTKEELNELKEKIETLNRKLAELTDEELEQVIGGVTVPFASPKQEGGNLYSEYFDVDNTTQQMDIHIYKNTTNDDFKSKY